MFSFGSVTSEGFFKLNLDLTRLRLNFKSRIYFFEFGMANLLIGNHSSNLDHEGGEHKGRLELEDL